MSRSTGGGGSGRAPDDATPRSGSPVAALVRDVDLREPPPAIDGGAVTRVLLLLRVGDTPAGELLLPVPGSGLTRSEVGAAVAGTLGAARRRAADGGGPANDRQERSRNRGRICSA